MSRFSFTNTPLSGLVVVQRTASEDERGFLSRLYCEAELRTIGLDQRIRQANMTFTRKKASVRGLHFQRPPYCDGKLVTCLTGAVYDVAVDIRRGSPTFLRWHGEILSADSRKSLWIPPGYAHGFQTLTEDCELVYLHTMSYEKDAEGALNVMDPALSIAWPLPIAELSDRDREHPHVSPAYAGLAL